ncbi:MAG: hypothetical protein QGG76_06655, partial [Candidatus Thalassarchaeaceae archaeon]|nr:hypothetical protein [Candidatus Thalassarchaeaceae archaeon]
EAIRSEASFLGLEVVAGELVGLVPLQAMINAGSHYHENPDEAVDQELVHAAITGLKLDVLDDFDPSSSIIEWAISNGGGTVDE